eukprot:TRINITY_DN7157_c0_g1_i1.p2 TRINITY_DN7157_c0_g1~~TRINITY_DN7157_c0_g1_i1.p2  ORF type:complete len:199 (+),score=33.17 TRINITY_DN7157_c0_g1_i1:54-650(+)
MDEEPLTCNNGDSPMRDFEDPIIQFDSGESLIIDFEQDMQGISYLDFFNNVEEKGQEMAYLASCLSEHETEEEPVMAVAIFDNNENQNYYPEVNTYFTQDNTLGPILKDPLPCLFTQNSGESIIVDFEQDRQAVGIKLSLKEEIGESNFGPYFEWNCLANPPKAFLSGWRLTKKNCLYALWPCGKNCKPTLTSKVDEA